MLYTEHIKDNKLFLRLYRKGKYTATEYFTAYYMPNKLPFNRFGITAGKKIGSAVVRNRAKRILREAYRKNELSMPIGYDIVFVARPGIVGAKTGDIERVLLSKVIKSMRSENVGADIIRPKKL
ncbi:MAG: ribonuclease P protein component [Oscillospiraceae bacterium]|nr:ribonuclease P protein component [Oscillospiraceae bacterium]